MIQQSQVETIGKLIKCLSLTSILYPLERVQNIQQIQVTYSNMDLRQNQHIVSQAIHNGIKSIFRGYMSFITKASILTFSTKIVDYTKIGKQKDQKIKQLLTLGFGAVAYLLVYPLQIVNMRMSVQVENQRFYSNVRECVSKIKKNQGIKTLYRGFLYSYALLAAQISTIQYNQNYFKRQKPQRTQWQNISLLSGMIAGSELILYPFNTIKKKYQINGAIGHIDSNTNIRTTLRQSIFTDLFRGFETRLLNITAYSLLFMLTFDTSTTRQ